MISGRDSRPKILVIGSGPIVIGQAAEFDYAGTQGCKALREEGAEVILVNSNPATIMTDNDVADSVYIEPLTVECLERIIKREHPSGLLGTLGGQTGLNLVVELEKNGILAKWDVKALGTSVQSIEIAEDRNKFRSLLTRIGEPFPQSRAVESVESASEVAREIGYPVVVRPAYTLGGTGGGIANNLDELTRVAQSGLSASRVGQVLIERSLVGWKEIEYEVMRDSSDNVITVCNMENMDPMGVHTGDSIVVAPSQTLSDKDYQRLRTASLNIIRNLEIEGGCNVQFAYRPKSYSAPLNDDTPMYYVIEVNPRVSRSSALASKATGYPIARVAAKIAMGLSLDEITNAVTGKSAAFEPALDYCVVKIPSWPFGKFPQADTSLGTQMKATGEAMAIDRTFEAALQKCVRSLDDKEKSSLLWENPSWRDEWQQTGTLDLQPEGDRLWKMTAAIRSGISPDDVSRVTGVDPWFTNAIARILKMERWLADRGAKGDISRELLLAAKRMGFSDAQIETLTDELQDRIRERRKRLNIRPVYKMVDTCAGEFEAVTPYFYSTYEEDNEASPLQGRRAVVLGSGPIRIGQGIEFDYCSVHASQALHKYGFKSIMINSNPETVSTDFDASDRLYFSPLDQESVLDVIENETRPDGPPPTLVQFGGQTAINLSQNLGRVNLPVLGSSPDVIDKASDRGRFEEVTRTNNIRQPPGGTAITLEQAIQVAKTVSYPVLVRPSYVLGGRAMEIVQSPEEMRRFFSFASEAAHGKAVFIDSYLEGIELEVDAVSDGKDVLIPGIMRHIEEAGVHSGDSMAVYPALDLSEGEVNSVVDYTRKVACALGVVGLMNIQFVITGRPKKFSSGDNGPLDSSRVHIIEVNPRSSRTAPFISKASGVPLIQIAVGAMLGRSIQEQGFSPGLAARSKAVAVKAPVFSMSKLTGADTFLGPEMKSTGEVMGIAFDFEAAIKKAFLAAGMAVSSDAPIGVSLSDKHKTSAWELLKMLRLGGRPLYATSGTAKVMQNMGIEVTTVGRRLDQISPTMQELIESRKVGAIVNTVVPERKVLMDDFYMRRAAVERRIPCFSSIYTAMAAVEAAENRDYEVLPMSEYVSGK